MPEFPLSSRLAMAIVSSCSIPSNEVPGRVSGVHHPDGLEGTKLSCHAQCNPQVKTKSPEFLNTNNLGCTPMTHFMRDMFTQGDKPA